MTAKLVCWKCGHPLRKDLPRTFPRLEQCKQCGSDLHVCRMCRHYAPRYISQCAHDMAEPPRDRELANFCQYFKPDPHAYVGREQREASAARRELDALFGTSQNNDVEQESKPEKTDDDPLNALDALFGGKGENPPG